MRKDFLEEIRSCPGLDPAVRDDFPMTKLKSHGKDFAYLNNAATALKPYEVIHAMDQYYSEYGSSVFRGVDTVAHKATTAFEAVRHKVAEFIGASKPEEIIFTAGTTASLNLVAMSYGQSNVKEGDEIVVSPTEHHANYVSWQQLALRQKAKLVIVEPDENGVVRPEELETVMSERTRMVCLSHITNVMGAENDLEKLGEVVHRYNAVFVVDGAQGIVHERPQVVAWGIDFYAFSAHKLYGPTGAGVLYGRYDLLEAMPPVIFGGEMIDYVDTHQSIFREPPYRFEAGTPAIAEVIGLGAAIEYMNSLGYCGIQKKVMELTKMAVDGLSELENVKIFNPNNYFSGIVSFNIKGVHPHDAASVYDREGISLRAGHHCSQPTMRWLKQNATLRASMAFYNTPEEIERLIETTKKAGDFLDVLF